MKSTAAIAAAFVAALAAGEAALADAVTEGREIAFDRILGNCLACHVMGDGSLPGNAGPPLMMMAQRYPNKADLRAQIYDATKRNPLTMMPPFGANHILTDEQIDKVVEYVYTL